MKKVLIISALVILATISTAFAETEVTVEGDKTRAELVADLINCYFPETTGKAIEKAGLGEYVIVTGPGGSEKIPFSEKLVAKLQKISVNPRSGEGLMDVCPTQAKKLKKVIKRQLRSVVLIIEEYSTCCRKCQ